jgi:hypothetical protein
MTKYLIAVLFAISTTAMAAETYVQGGMGLTKYDFGNATDDQQGTNYFAAMGYVFDNHLGVEGEYEYINDADLASGTKLDNQQNINVYGVGRLPLDNLDKVNLIAKVGFGHGSTKINGDTDYTWYPAFGGGVEWLVTDSWGVVGLVDYKSYDYSTGGNDVSADPISYKAAVQYRF